VRRSKFIFFLLPLVFITAGCDKTKEVLGLKRERPDEFQVIERPPLSMPPGYGLRPPHPGEEGKAMHSPQKEAEASLLGEEQSSVEGESETESELLEKAQVEKKDTEIRQKLKNETEKPPSVGEKMAFWKNQKKGDIIDPKEENKKYNGSELPGKSTTTPGDRE